MLNALLAGCQFFFSSLAIGLQLGAAAHRARLCIFLADHCPHPHVHTPPPFAALANAASLAATVPGEVLIALSGLLHLAGQLSARVLMEPSVAAALP